MALDEVRIALRVSSIDCSFSGLRCARSNHSFMLFHVCGMVDEC